MFSWLLSLAVLVICVISPLELPSLNTEVWGDPLLVERCGLANRRLEAGLARLEEQEQRRSPME